MGTSVVGRGRRGVLLWVDSWVDVALGLLVAIGNYLSSVLCGSVALQRCAAAFLLDF
jgi:hypothetical protein